MECFNCLGAVAWFLLALLTLVSGGAGFVFGKSRVRPLRSVVHRVKLYDRVAEAGHHKTLATFTGYVVDVDLSGRPIRLLMDHESFVGSERRAAIRWGYER